MVIKAADEQIDKDIPGLIRIQDRIRSDKRASDRTSGADCIVGLNDMIAFGIMDALYDEKYRVARDMSVMGCDNTLFAKVKEVSLTTIEHFVIYKGMDACDIIMKKMKSRTQKYTEIDPVSIYHVEYEPKLVMRGTTSYPRSEKPAEKIKN